MQESNPRIIKHTRFITLLKYGLLAVGIVLAAVLIILPQLNKSTTRFEVLVTDETGEEQPAPRTSQMIKPRFQGVNSEGHPYNVLAETASRESEEIINLEVINADVVLEDNDWVSVISDTGKIYLERKYLELDGNVDVFTGKGLEFRTNHMDIDIEKGIAFSKVPVELQSSLGVLYAKGFEVEQSTELLVFTGPVKLIIYPE